MPEPGRPEARAAEAFPLRRTGPSDRYFDYCLEPYRPRRPTAGKLRAENLLLETFALAGVLDRALPVLEALRRSLGTDMVVWGAKHDGARLFWEIYVYDPRKEEPRATVAGLREALEGILHLRPEVRETLPYMMVSFDLDSEILEAGEVEELNLYLAGTREHAGRSYVVTERGLELANIYRFLRPKRDVETLLGLVKSSAFLDFSSPVALARVIPPELFACKKICVAKKRLRDGLYYSGVEIGQLLWFLRRFGYPEELVDFARRHEGALDHLYFDVGLDFEQDAAGTIRTTKTSFYGTF